jgi:6-phosphogluconolactonase
MTREVLDNFESADQLAHKAASDLASRVLDLIEDQVVHVVLTGGTVGIKTLEQLAPLLAGKNLSNLQLWWGDERFVAEDSPDRNFVQAKNALVSKILIPETNLHPFPAAGSLSLSEAASTFESHLQSVAPRFDIVLLGMGPDAHVASLFPDSDAPSYGENVVAESNSPKPPSQRLSLSYTALSSATEVWFLVAGTDKADAVNRVFRGEDLPASKVTGKKITRWYLDADAAARIRT